MIYHYLDFRRHLKLTNGVITLIEQQMHQDNETTASQ